MTRRVLRGFDPRAFADARKNRGLKVNDLSRMTDVAASTIHNWEAGKGTPTVDLLARVMNYLETPIDQVVTIAPEDRYPGDWRVVTGMTQPELAAAAGIATTTLRGIERADITLTDVNAANLARLLGLDAQVYRDAYQRARRRPPNTSA